MRNAERAEASSSLKLSTQVYVANIFTVRTLVSFRKDTAYIIGLFFFLLLLSQGSGTTVHNQPSSPLCFAKKPGELRTKKGIRKLTEALRLMVLGMH